MADLKWIKLTIDMFEDEKIDYIETLPEADAIQNIWIRLLTMAGKCNDHGFIYLTEDIPYNDELLAHKFKRPLNTVRLALQVFQKLGMIETMGNGYISVINWSKHQSLDKWEKKQEQDRSRQANRRAKLKELTDNSPKLLEDGLQTERMSRDSSVTSTVTVTQSHAVEEEEDDKIEDIRYKIEEEDQKNSSSSSDVEKMVNLLSEGKFKGISISTFHVVSSWIIDLGINEVESAIHEAIINKKTESLSYLHKIIIRKKKEKEVIKTEEKPRKYENFYL